MLEKIAIVLVEPREPGNIGAAARAMANMGLSRLVLVRPPDHLVADAFRMALAARPILESAAVADDLAQALAGFGFVAGTTRRRGAGRRGRVTPRQLAAELPAVAAANDIAILFGREDSGLTNEELQYCQRLVTIPSSEGFGSLNLAQSVLAIAYEIFLVDDCVRFGWPGPAGAARSDRRSRGTVRADGAGLAEHRVPGPGEPGAHDAGLPSTPRPLRARRTRGQGVAGDFPASGLVRRAARRTARDRERRRS